MVPGHSQRTKRKDAHAPGVLRWRAAYQLVAQWPRGAMDHHDQPECAAEAYYCERGGVAMALPHTGDGDGMGGMGWYGLGGIGGAAA